MEQTIMKPTAKDKLQKEWKTWAVAIWMVAVTGFLFYINVKIDRLKATDEFIVSNIDSIESVVINNDATIIEISKSIKAMEPNIIYIRNKVRRR